ncbi:nucleoid-associated protein [Thalassolituus sp. ST750PaO-4]|uniref:nucleoid-associated protein n=1 Tax=Thalassolituus sp. ST750PaO-4 TaxID=2742965 RepID=UPI001CE23C6F|nr:nucleoid-associated protein [Thalassolituus sp. ST750PaO-4]MCA6061817.1 nucleoid-associated protein [Thalassolituus sp. ST750PaO-4]
MGIKNIIVHEVYKDEKTNKAVVRDRKSENTIDAHAEELSSQLASLFKKTGLNTGGFSSTEDENEPPHFQTLLTRFYLGGEFKDFLTFSTAATKYFARKWDASSSTKGGYLLFNHYSHGGDYFLSVVLLRKKFGLSLSDDLTLDEIEQLDLDKLHMAARINLSVWLAGGASKYISFRIGKSASDVTDYFSEFIGCEEYTRARVDTQNLVAVTKMFCSELGFDDVTSENVRSFVFDQCIKWMEDEVPVELDKLSSMLDSRYSPKEKGVFLVIAQNEPFQLTNELPIERSALRGLTRFKGSDKKISISFDTDLLNVSVFYNGKGELLIKDVPAELKRQLEETLKAK